MFQSPRTGKSKWIAEVADQGPDVEARFKALARARANGSCHFLEVVGGFFQFQSPRTGKSKWIPLALFRDQNLCCVSKPSHGQEQMDHKTGTHPEVTFVFQSPRTGKSKWIMPKAIPPFHIACFKALARARANGSGVFPGDYKCCYSFQSPRTGKSKWIAPRHGRGRTGKSRFKALARARANGSGRVRTGSCTGGRFQSPRTGKSKWIRRCCRAAAERELVSKPSHGQEQMDQFGLQFRD